MLFYIILLLIFIIYVYNFLKTNIFVKHIDLIKKSYPNKSNKGNIITVIEKY